MQLSNMAFWVSKESDIILNTAYSLWVIEWCSCWFDFLFLCPFFVPHKDEEYGILNQKQKLINKTCFEKEAQDNLEMAY